MVQPTVLCVEFATTKLLGKLQWFQYDGQGTFGFDPRIYKRSRASRRFRKGITNIIFASSWRRLNRLTVHKNEVFQQMFRNFFRKIENYVLESKSLTCLGFHLSRIYYNSFRFQTNVLRCSVGFVIHFMSFNLMGIFM